MKVHLKSFWLKGVESSGFLLATSYYRWHLARSGIWILDSGGNQCKQSIAHGAGNSMGGREPLMTALYHWLYLSKKNGLIVRSAFYQVPTLMGQGPDRERLRLSLTSAYSVMLLSRIVPFAGGSWRRLDAPFASFTENRQRGSA